MAEDNNSQKIKTNMNLLSEDLDDSALFCKSLVQKRKATASVYPKQSKQLRLNFSQKSPQDNQSNAPRANENNCETNGNESTSSYFHSKKPSNVCPLCLKSFKTDCGYSTHMKQCAKAHKMTTQQLLEALNLQKKQMQERRDLGLCSQNIPIVKRSVSKKKDGKEKDSYDLALGLAMSESLTTCKSKDAIASSGQKTTLEQFGVTTNSIQGPSLGRKKKVNTTKCVLKERTAEDRQKIVIEKVAVVLLDEEEELSLSERPNSIASSQSNQSAGLVNMGTQLWDFGENCQKQGWYVDKIRSLLLAEETNVEAVRNLDGEVVLEEEISKLNLPQGEIHKDWKKMVNSGKYSDLRLRTKDAQTFNLHSVVLHARQPQILEEDYESVFEKYNLSTIIIFLEYVYCGTLDGLVRWEMKKLGELATELKCTELVSLLNCLENKLSGDCQAGKYGSHMGRNKIEGKDNEISVVENKAQFLEEKDLFTEEDPVNLTQSCPRSAPEAESSDNESNAEKSYWSFLQHEKARGESEGRDADNWIEASRVEKESPMVGSESGTTEKELDGLEGRDSALDREDVSEEKRRERESEDSATRDLDDVLRMRSNSSDCIVLSSGSESQESKTREDLHHSQGDRQSPSLIDIDYEVPYFDPFDNFHCFSEEPFSPVNAHSQSLVTGDVSMGSPKSVDAAGKSLKEPDGLLEERPQESAGYCSTPVTVRRSVKVRSLKKDALEGSRKRRSDLSGSRILRKSLGLELKAKNRQSRTFERKSGRRKDFAEVLTDSVLNELSVSSTLKSSTPVRGKNLVEMTPIPGRDDFGESDTPSPNYSKMEETLLKEQLSRYGLKKNLSKTKARKILRHIYEELHPLYNTESGKIVKLLSANTPKPRKKAKPKSRSSGSNAKPKPKKNPSSDGSSDTLEGPIDYNTDGSDFENLSETLTQTAPSNPVDLPSAFNEFLENNPEYHEKILLYEPIWLEELQKKLKENFKKHFKMADLMDYLDQQCITFRSATQVRNAQKKNEKKKGNCKK